MFIFSNLAMSLDGKIATRERNLFALGTAEDRRQMLILRKKCDALIMGATTLRSFKKPCFSGPNLFTPINIVLSSKLEGFSLNWEFFTHPALTRILIVSHLAPSKNIKKFSNSSEILVLKKPTHKNPTAAQIIRYLEDRGIKILLIEGGGGIMWDFVEYGFIDEFHVTLTPQILGGIEAPTLVDGVGFDQKNLLRLKLKKCRVVGNELYLVYKPK